MHHRRLHRVPDVCRPRSADGSTPLGAEESLPGAHRTPKIPRSYSNSGNVHPDAAEGQRGRLNAPFQKSSHECETHTDRNHSSQRPIVRFRGDRPNSSRWTPTNGATTVCPRKFTLSINRLAIQGDGGSGFLYKPHLRGRAFCRLPGHRNKPWTWIQPHDLA